MVVKVEGGGGGGGVTGICGGVVVVVLQLTNLPQSGLPKDSRLDRGNRCAAGGAR